MRILIVAPSGIGDAVVTSGVVDHLIREHPDCRVTVASAPAAGALFAAMPNLERIIVVRKRRLGLHWLEILREVAATRWDLVVDFKGSGLSFLLRARRRALWPGRSPAPMYRTCAAMLGITPAPWPVAWTRAADEAKAEALLPATRPLVALCPTAGWAPKAWAPERFAELFGKLAEGPLPGAVPVVFGGPGAAERAMAQPLIDRLPDVVDLCGILTLPEAAAAIARCALYVGNDSGLTHLAAATGTPTVGLCGTTIARAAEMSPVGRAATWALAAGPSMEELSVEQAFAACERVLARGGEAIADGMPASPDAVPARADAGTRSAQPAPSRAWCAARG